MSTSDSSKDKLLNDLQQVIKDAEDLLKNAEQQTGAGFQNARAKCEFTLKNAKAEIVRMEDMVVTKTKEAAQATDTYVKENPWQSIGIAAGIGLLLGVVISRSK